MTTAEPHTLEEMISLCGEDFGSLVRCKADLARLTRRLRI